LAEQGFSFTAPQLGVIKLSMSRDLNVDQIKKLWTLDLIIRSGSLKKASLLAKVSPSAISQTLSSLEKTLGKPLLVRDRGVITPTPDALAILEVVRPAFDAFEKLRDLNHAPLPKMSWLNFGTYESIAVDVLPGMLQSIRQKMPHLRLSLRISRTANLLTMVRKGELCSALITEVDDLDRFYVKEVTTDRLGLFVSSRHPISRLGWKAIEDFGIGSLAPGKDGLPRYFTKFMKQLDDIRPFVLSDSFETLRAAAAAGTIVSVLPHRVAMRNGDLMEIYPPKTKTFKESGRHKICVVSQSNCDPEETDFLAAEASRFLQN
jgi:DNA-binding transcriptional LysR family regulator